MGPVRCRELGEVEVEVEGGVEGEGATGLEGHLMCLAQCSMWCLKRA